MTDFFREVNEDYRRDRAIATMRRYQTPMIILAVLIVIATIATRLYLSRQQSQAEAAGARYEAAAQLARDGKTDEAIAALTTVAGEGPAGTALLAKFRVAGQRGRTDRAAAVKAYDDLAADPTLDPTLADLARLRAAFLRIDEADDAEVHRRLDSLATPTSPFRSSARELLALRALAADDLTAAGRWLDQIVVDPQAPPSLRQRAEGFLGLVTGGPPPKS